MNVLIALIDPAHVRHDDAHRWFAADGQTDWATCPFTQNGVMRILGSNRYPNSPGPPAAVAEIMARLCVLPGHKFWPDDISLLDGGRVRAGYLSDSAQITDTYLLALARTHSGRLATFNRQLVTNAVFGGAETLHLIA